MNKILFMLLTVAMPLLGMAQQDAAVATKNNNTVPKGAEISLSGGLAVRTEADYGSDLTGAFCTNISALYNINKLQFGIGINVDGIPDDYTDIQPHLLINRTFSTKRMYFYAGGMAGYATRRYDDYHTQYINGRSNGYVLGLQGGAVLKLGKHFGINAEVALRSVQYWTKEYIGYYYYDTRYVYEKTTNKFEASMPVKIGVRYRF